MQITLKMTCGACPEQYDAFDETGKMVGYLRLRHGNFTVECPDVGGQDVFYANPKGDGLFEEDERDFYLTAAKSAIENFYKDSKIGKYVVAYISFHDNVLTQEVIEAESEVAAIKIKLGETIYGDEDTVEEMQSLAFNCDSMVSVIKI